jgi:hypothetical protein
MRASPLACRTFIVKHTAGMCGVGKFMKRWGEREFDTCPRCDMPEDACHVWKCHGKDADNVWATSLQKLEQKLIELDTDPDLQALLLLLLDNWRFDRTLSADLPPYLKDLAQKQALLSGNRLLEGWLRPDWQWYQQRYYCRIWSKRNGRRWLVAVIQKLWDTAWDLWDHRNNVLHEQDSTLTVAMSNVIQREVIYTYNTLQGWLLPRKDAYLVKFPLEDLLRKDDSVKQAWLHGAKLALLGPSAGYLKGMKNCMRQWLGRSTRCGTNEPSYQIL